MELAKQPTGGAPAAAAQSTTGNEGNSSTEVAQRSTSSLLPHDVREIQAVSEYASRHEEKLKTLTDEFAKKGGVKLFWDSKVPEKNKRFYYFFSLKSSNKNEVVAEIKKYLDFYKQMDELVQKIGNDELTAGEGENPYGLVLDLCEDLNKLFTAAEAEIKTTDSSTVYELHRQFVAKHEKLENMIKRVECVALKKSWKSASDGLVQSLKAIDGLRSDLQASEAKYSRMCERFDRLLTQNERLIDQQQALLEENDKMMQQQQTLLEDNKKMKQQQDTLIKENNIIKTILKSIAKEDGNDP